MQRSERTASVQGDVHRYAIPRSDLHVTVDDVTIKPALALGGWLVFQPAAGGAVVMGDLVLSETEIEPVMTKLGNDDAQKLAKGLQSALEGSRSRGAEGGAVPADSRQ